jgi:ABC-type Na+ efflux pump permease subunit
MVWNRVKAIIKKDLSEVGVNKMVVIPMIIVPLILCVLVPAVLLFIALSADMEMINGIEFIEKILPYYPVPEGMNNLTLKILYVFLNFSFIPFFMIVPLMVSSIIASNGIVGEKERKTLETLLYTPITNREFLTGKLSAALIPAILLSWTSFLLFFGVSNIISCVLADVIIISSPMWIPSMLLLAPSVSLLGLAITLLVSLKARTFMEAQQMSGVVVLPFIILIIVQIMGILVFNLLFILFFALVLFGAGVLIVLRLAPRFTRETIITRVGT